MKDTDIKWKKVEGTEDVLVSNFGDVVTEGGYVFKPIDKNGYKNVNLVINGVKKGCLIHRLVAKAFVPNPFNKPQVNHKNGDTSNNCEWNLEWNTAYENQMHRRYVLGKDMDGENNPMFGASGKDSPKYAEDIYALTEDGEVKGVFHTQTEAAEKLWNIRRRSNVISRCLRHDRNLKTLKGLFFLYQTEYERMKQADLKPRELLEHPELWCHYYHGQSATKPQSNKQ